MGAAMARRLVAAGHDVVIWNRSAEAAQRVAAEVAVTVAPTAAAAVRDVPIVLAMLADGTVTQSVLLDAATISAMHSGQIVVDMATGGVEAAQELGTQLLQHGIRFVDGPVSGSVASVDSGQLLIMASGSPEDVAAAEPVLLAFAKRVIRVGDIGAGQAMKLSVNLVVHALNAAVSEGLAMASRAGISLDSAYDVLEDSAVAAPFVKYKRAAFLDPEAPTAMTLALTKKDLTLITDRAAAVGIDAGVAWAALDEVTEACATGLDDKDMAHLMRHLLA